MQQLGSKLNSLIKNRSYAAGRHARLESEKFRLLARLEEIEAKQLGLDEEISQIDEQIGELSRIDTDHIRPQKPSERVSNAPHGQVIKGVVEYFRDNAGIPIRTDALQLVVASLSGFTGGPRTKLSARTVEICWHLKQRGWIERLPDCRVPETGRTLGVWRWVGNEAMNAVDKARGLDKNSGSAETLAAIVEPVNGDA